MLSAPRRAGSAVFLGILLGPLAAPSVWALTPTPAGTLPAEVVEASRAGLFSLPAPVQGLPASSLQRDWLIPVLMVDFSDQPGTYPPETFQRSLFDTTGSVATGTVFDYYVWVSGDRVHVKGEVVGWIRLPYPKTYYANLSWGLNRSSTPANSYGAVFHALPHADSLVDFARYDRDGDGYVDMLWLLHSGLGGEATITRDNLWSITSRMAFGWTNGSAYVSQDTIPGTQLPVKVDRFSILPEISPIHPDSPCEIGVFCHEFGHALGLPDLYDTSTLGGTVFVGPGNWSLMATGVYGGDGLTPETPPHVGAWASLFLGWTQSFRPAADSLVTLAPLENGGAVADFWFQGLPYYDHFLIENRQRIGFDRSLRQSGLLVYHVNETVIGSRIESNRINIASSPGLLLLEADGRGDLMAGRNRGDEGDPFPGRTGRSEMDDFTNPNTRSFSGAPTGIALRHVEAAGENMRAFLQVQPAGWTATRAWSSPDFSPELGLGSGNLAASQADGTLDVVWVDRRDDPRRVYWRRKWAGALWDLEQPLSGSLGDAFDPTVAASGRGSLYAAWTERRQGVRQLWGRAFLAGAWLPERQISEGPWDSRTPAVAMDATGRVTLAWLQEQPARTHLLVTQFLAGDPPGPVTDIGDTLSRPRSPVVATDTQGTAYLAWPDPRGGNFALGYVTSRGLQDSSWAAAKALPNGGSRETVALTLASDPGRNLYVIWQQAGPGHTELHYQRRLAGAASPSDSLLEDRGETIQNPRLVADSTGGMHLTFEAQTDGVFQVLYRRYSPALGWDFLSTRITSEPQVSALRPIALPGRDGHLTLLWYRYDGAYQADERTRILGEATLVAVGPGAPRPELRLRLGPNPLRPGRELLVDLAAGRGEVEVVDVTGRRMARAFADDQGAARFSASSTAHWPSGVYFARETGAAARSATFVVLR